MFEWLKKLFGSSEQPSQSQEAEPKKESEQTGQEQPAQVSGEPEQNPETPAQSEEKKENPAV